MRCPFLALYTMGSCPVLKSTALSFPGWISILILGIKHKYFRSKYISDLTSHHISVLDADSPPLNYIDCILFLSNDTEFSQKLKQVVTLYYQIPLKQPQSKISADKMTSHSKSHFVKALFCKNLICSTTFCLGSSHVMWKTIMPSVKLLTEIPEMSKLLIVLVYKHTHSDK